MSIETEFNASICVTDLLMKTIENAAKDLAIRCVKEIAKRHEFDADEEIRILGLNNTTLIRKQMAKRVKKEKKEKPEIQKKEKAFPLPFIAELVNNDGCKGIVYNHGLFTQCQQKRMEEWSFCKGCKNQADKNPRCPCPICL